MTSSPRPQGGFTLIEIIMALMVVGLLREEVMYLEYTPAKTQNNDGLLAFKARPPLPNLSATVKSVVRHDLRVVINYPREFDPQGRTE